MFSNVKYNEELINRHLLSTLFRKSIINTRKKL